MPSRLEVVHRIESLVGPSLRIEDARNGWPAFAEIEIDDRLYSAAIYVGDVHQSHRGKPGERRFQNPEQNRPIVEYPGRVTVLLGVWAEDTEVHVSSPVLVLPEFERRVGRNTRWSMFTSVATLQIAAETGWSTQVTTSGEHVSCFFPELLPLAIASLIAGVEPDEHKVQTVVSDTGNLGRIHEHDGHRARARRAVSALIRDAWFRGDVLDAYERSCAMCGLGLNLVQGAHIYPASAPGSLDIVSNGIALCANHHVAFDQHEIAVIPGNFDVVFRPDILETAEWDSAAELFVSTTFRTLRLPRANAEPDSGMLMLRYEYFAGKYDWLPRL
jgi:hypothetical protein